MPMGSYTPGNSISVLRYILLDNRINELIISAVIEGINFAGEAKRESA